NISIGNPIRIEHSGLSPQSNVINGEKEGKIMDELDNKPVVIASSLTGLLISYSLSQARIPHILIGGDAPADIPRLGESINEAASIDFRRFLGLEFGQYFYKKNHICLMNGSILSMSYSGNPGQGVSTVLPDRKKAAFSMVPNGLIHLDRSKFDKALYHKVKASPYCMFIHNTKANVVYDPTSDTVMAIALDDEHRLEQPRYVFDATGPLGLVARAAGVSKKAVSDRERLAWTHYWTEPGRPLPKVWWLYGTNVLRLDADRDGIEGIAWLIPLGNTISIGLSVNAATYPIDQISKEALIRKLDEAFARRGIAYRQFFTKTKPIIELSHEYFIRDRAYGNNWLLAGSGYIQIWFPTATGVASSMLAAVLAPRFLQDPTGTGRYYEETQKPLLAMHNYMHQVIKSPPFTTIHEGYNFLAKAITLIGMPLIKYLRATNNDLNSSGLAYVVPEKVLMVAEKSELLQLFMAASYMSIEKPPTLADQGRAFKHYFNYPLLNVKNSVSVFPKFYGSKFFNSN
ncbi:MAG: hypothetical protein KDJ52_24890, partial [Anaerolineae bacterium]|nr:hypothetical protein [Anaerolineae bacterium]